MYGDVSGTCTVTDSSPSPIKPFFVSLFEDISFFHCNPEKVDTFVRGGFRNLNCYLIFLVPHKTFLSIVGLCLHISFISLQSGEDGHICMGRFKNIYFLFVRWFVSTYVFLWSPPPKKYHVPFFPRIITTEHPFRDFGGQK